MYVAYTHILVYALLDNTLAMQMPLSRYSSFSASTSSGLIPRTISRGLRSYYNPTRTRPGLTSCSTFFYNGNNISPHHPLCRPLTTTQSPRPFPPTPLPPCRSSPSYHLPSPIPSSAAVTARQLQGPLAQSARRHSSTMAANQEYPLLCLENPLLDIQAVGTEELLKKYDLKANDAILASEKHLPLYDELLSGYDAKLIAGGAAQNTARGAAYVLPPDSVVYLGGVGDDKYAAILRDAVRQAGLRVEYRVDPVAPTGRCGVVITGHNRSLCTDLGAANHYDLAHLRSPAVWPLVRAARFYYVGGYHFTVCPDAILALGEEAAAHGKTFIVNVSAPFIPEFFKDPLDASSKYWDYVVCNESEAAAYARSHDLPAPVQADVAAIARHLAGLPKANTARPRIAVITQGTEPTIVAVQGEAEVRRFPVHAIDASLINDTNGAGDAFAGGFVAGLVQGVPLETAVDMGHWLARLSIQELGPS
ncbi:Ribokinase-like protein [Durotheca rogersii]|uniref:Ribokinase-like protein n=1 Tax=Durotheca rogersii TaxID=419775 RepID=UPI00222019AF|nr:Ribokinase-like protein [Durotheca rogersii]KAI5867950.1 Ribokinase-like protein [Durotheca rogersii]